MRPKVLSPALLTLPLAIACQPAAPEAGDTDAPADQVCLDDATFFRDELYPKVVKKTCMGCHVADGLARESSLVFVSEARPDHLSVNAALLADLAGLERDGTSVVLLKPQGLEEHGGGEVLQPDGAPFALLQEFVRRLDAPVTCPTSGDQRTGDEGLVLLAATETLRKAAVLLAGRLPSPQETNAVRAGGEPALGQALWTLMDEEAFTEVFLDKLNDLLLTDRYLRGTDGLSLLDDEAFPSLYWYTDAGAYGDDDDLLQARTSAAIAREPLELAAHLLHNDLPWTELLTADYRMVNAYSAMSYGVPDATWPDADDPASLDFRPVKVEGVPHAGLLSTPAFLSRYPTTDTNRNRHRAWFFFKTFLATDILTFADRPIDPTVSNVHNPTMNDPQCTVCHATMDPVAGTFQNWEADAALVPVEEPWYADMRPPGFGDRAMPADRRTNALGWLAQQATTDPRFAVATVQTMLQAFTGVQPLTALTAGDDPARQEALAQQDAWVQEVAAELAARGFDIKYAIERVLTSRYFRAVGDVGATPGSLVHAGTAHLLTPEELDRKIVATLGYPWRRDANSRTYLRDRYRMLYGGIDSFGVTARLRDPNGVMGAIGLRMANEMACEAVPHDLVLDREQRRLLPFVELSFEPVTDDGFEVPEAKAAILRNLQWLHLRLLGEDLALDDPELQASWELWRDVWQGGKDLLAIGEASSTLPSACSATIDPWTGDNLPAERSVRHDPRFTLRAWAAVLSYLLADWRFLHE